MSGSDVLDWGTRTLGLASVSDLMALAARGRQDTAGVRFLPYLSPAGERAPFFDPAARGCLSGLSLHAAPADIARALLEGVTLAIRDCLAASPVTPEVLALCGGGARSEVWTRLIADVTGLPVTVPADSEVGARGAWLAGMVATGREPDIPTAAARYVRTAAMRVPDPRAAEAYAERYDGFLRLRQACQPAWHGPAGGAGA
jgi:xylulokinase